MRLSPLIIAAVVLAGCASAPATKSTQRTAGQHALNVAAAQDLRYQVKAKDGQTLFCIREPPTGSHISPGCLSESQWEQRLLSTWRMPFCPAAATSCTEPGHSLVVFVDSP